MTDKIGPEKNKEEYTLIISTINSLEEAEKLAEMLVKEKTAACVSVSSPVLSIYRWKDNVETEKEVMLFIKTTRENFPKVERLILENHSYEVPEIIAIPILYGEKRYLTWLSANTGP